MRTDYKVVWPNGHWSGLTLTETTRFEYKKRRYFSLGPTLFTRRKPRRVKSRGMF